MEDFEPHANSTIVAHQGGKLSRREATLLEERIAIDPNDIKSRVSLLGHYHRASFLTWSGFLRTALGRKPAHHQRYIQLIVWFIKNKADTCESGLVEMYPPYSFDEFEDLKELWLKAVDEHPNNVTVLCNAASFFHHNDKDYSERLLHQAQELLPASPYLHSRLSQIHSLRARYRPDLLRSALSEKEAEIDNSSEYVNPYSLGHIAELAFALGDYDKASDAAERLIALAEEERSTGSDRGNGIHDGNNVLGRLAFKRGDIETAKSYLSKAARSPGAPSLSSFGPHMDLAQDLLDHGERVAVLKYLWNCHRFWNGICGSPPTIYWIIAIILGFKPRLNRVRQYGV